jgi:hypothetical protein
MLPNRQIHDLRVKYGTELLGKESAFVAWYSYPPTHPEQLDLASANTLFAD